MNLILFIRLFIILSVTERHTPRLLLFRHGVNVNLRDSCKPAHHDKVTMFEQVFCFFFKAHSVRATKQLEIFLFFFFNGSFYKFTTALKSCNNLTTIIHFSGFLMETLQIACALIFPFTKMEIHFSGNKFSLSSQILVNSFLLLHCRSTMFTKNWGH